MNNTCKECKFWDRHSLTMGSCRNEETLLNTSCTDSCNELETNQDFGCINFKDIE